MEASFRALDRCLAQTRPQVQLPVARRLARWSGGTAACGPVPPLQVHSVDPQEQNTSQKKAYIDHGLLRPSCSVAQRNGLQVQSRACPAAARHRVFAHSAGSSGHYYKLQSLHLCYVLLYRCGLEHQRRAFASPRAHFHAWQHPSSPAAAACELAGPAPLQQLSSRAKLRLVSAIGLAFPGPLALASAVAAC